MNKSQEQFELWAAKHRLPLRKDGVVVSYAARATDDAWQAWMASRELLQPVLERFVRFNEEDDTKDDMENMIEYGEMLKAARRSIGESE